MANFTSLTILVFPNKTSVNKLHLLIIKIKCFAVNLETKCVLDGPQSCVGYIAIFIILLIPKEKKNIAQQTNISWLPISKIQRQMKTISKQEIWSHRHSTLEQWPYATGQLEDSGRHNDAIWIGFLILLQSASGIVESGQWIQAPFV